MSFVSIPSNIIKVGDPITKDLMEKIKDNLDDHESRIQTLTETSVTIQVINGDVSFYGYSPTEPDIFNYKARQTLSIFEFRVQLFSKQNITSGFLNLQLEKSNNTDNAGFTSILSSDLSFNFATDINYSEKVAQINANANTININQVLRIRVLSVPAGFTGKILVYIGAQ